MSKPRPSRGPSNASLVPNFTASYSEIYSGDLEGALFQNECASAQITMIQKA